MMPNLALMPNNSTIEGYACAAQCPRSTHFAVVPAAPFVWISGMDMVSLQKEQAKLIPLFPKQRVECITKRKGKAGSGGSMG